MNQSCFIKQLPNIISILITIRSLLDGIIDTLIEAEEEAWSQHNDSCRRNCQRTYRRVDWKPLHPRRNHGGSRSFHKHTSTPRKSHDTSRQ